MKKMIFILSCVFTLGLAFQSCNNQNNEKLQTEVQRELRDKYNNSSLSSSVQNGVVTLSGTVESQAQKDAVERDVKAVRNVKTVVNNISIRETTISSNQPMMNQNQDNTIKTSIESRLRTEGFDEVDVAVNDGEVTLSGDLRRNDLTKVMQIANESNPRKVTNKLTLK